MAVEIDKEILIVFTWDIRIDIDTIVSKKKGEETTETIKSN